MKFFFSFLVLHSDQGNDGESLTRIFEKRKRESIQRRQTRETKTPRTAEKSVGKQGAHYRKFVTYSKRTFYRVNFFFKNVDNIIRIEFIGWGTKCFSMVVVHPVGPSSFSNQPAKLTRGFFEIIYYFQFVFFSYSRRNNKTVLFSTVINSENPVDRVRSATVDTFILRHSAGGGGSFKNVKKRFQYSTRFTRVNKLV